MSAFKTFAEYLRQKECIESTDVGTQPLDVQAAKEINYAAAKAMQKMHGRQVVKSVSGDPNAQKKLLTRTLMGMSSTNPANNIGSVSKVLNIGKKTGSEI